MSRPRAADGGSSVLSFTFLDVLMCTMGSLLLLLVVFGVIAQKATRKRREGEVANISLAALAAPKAVPAASAPDAQIGEQAAENPDDLRKQLEELETEQQRLDKLRAEAAEARERERARISHLEDHERRLEHELAKLQLALQALEDAEKQQQVDQAQADSEAERLKKLIAETEDRLAKMREDVGEKSYAIVPYKGANGTFRRPVFIECTADAVTIQPEGIRLTVEDFDGPLRSGNPLAAAVRAAHEELNKRALAAGAELPDAYPLLIVRPDGAAAYSVALDAIRSWDTDFGYEFVEADWNLEFPEPDPRLGQVMAHAVDEARQRQALLAQVAPGRYGPRLGSGGSGGGLGGDGEDGPGGDSFIALSASDDGRIGSRASDGSLGGGPGGSSGRGNPLRGGAVGAGANFSEEFTGTGGGGSGAPGTGAENTPGMLAAQTDGAADGEGYLGPRYGRTAGSAGNSADGTPANGQMAGQSGGGGSEPANGGTAAQAGSGAAGQAAPSLASGAAAADASSGAAGSSAFAGSASSAAGGAGGTSSSMTGATGRGASGNIGSSDEPSSPLTTARGSIADSRGVNWANVEASRRASAITRPIRVQVSAEQIEMPADAATSGSEAQSVSFHQPADRVMDQLAGAVQSRIQDWGLAGDGMYWRPTLVVSIAPGAERQARRVAELLENSGIDVKLPQSIATAAEGDGRATR
jgi:hypothetical protein